MVLGGFRTIPIKGMGQNPDTNALLNGSEPSEPGGPQRTVDPVDPPNMVSVLKHPPAAGIWRRCSFSGLEYFISTSTTCQNHEQNHQQIADTVIHNPHFLSVRLLLDIILLHIPSLGMTSPSCSIQRFVPPPCHCILSLRLVEFSEQSFEGVVTQHFPGNNCERKEVQMSLSPMVTLHPL